MSIQREKSKVFKNESISNRQAGEGFLAGDLVRCKLTYRMGVAIDVFYDINISNLKRIVRIEVQFSYGDSEIFSPRELDFVESSE